jgi:hypothetical protein
VPLIVPPVIVAFPLVRFVPVKFKAVSVVPEAVAKPSQTVEVAFVVVEFVIVVPWREVVPVAVRLVTFSFKIFALFAKSEVVVVFVPVPFVQMSPPVVRLVGLKLVAESVVKMAVVAKRDVDVALVVVEFVKIAVLGVV